MEIRSLNHMADTYKDQLRELFDDTAKEYFEGREQVFSFQSQKKLVLELLESKGGESWM
jgi:hypothetical protein